MNISFGNQHLSEIIHICFNEEDQNYYERIHKTYLLDTKVKKFIEDRYDHIIHVWNRFIRFKTRKENDFFYYSSPIISGLGYPPDYIVSLGIIMYIKKNRDKHIILHTQKKDLISFFLKKKFVFSHLFSKSVLNTFIFLIHYIFSKIFLYKANSPCIIVHSFHNDSFFQGYKYVTSKVPNLDSIAEKNSYKFYHDINPNFFSLRNIFKFRHYKSIYSPRYLNVLSIFSLYFQSVFYLFKNKMLFKCFYFSTNDHYSKIFFDLIKRKSLVKLINKLSADSYFIIPWENRGYQLGIEKDLKAQKLIKYSCGILSKVAPEYVNYRYLRHRDFALHIAMSKKVREFLLKLEPTRKISIVKSPRVFSSKESASKPDDSINKVLVICPIDESIARHMIQSFLHQKQYNVKFKLHPYTSIKIPEQKKEKRALSDCFRDYSIAIYDGFTTASMEAYLAGLSVYRFSNPNRLSFDTMDDVDIKTIGDFDQLKVYQPVFDETFYNDYMGFQEIGFYDYIKKLLVKNEDLNP